MVEYYALKSRHGIVDYYLVMDDGERILTCKYVPNNGAGDIEIWDFSKKITRTAG